MANFNKKIKNNISKDPQLYGIAFENFIFSVLKQKFPNRKIEYGNKQNIDFFIHKPSEHSDGEIFSNSVYIELKLSLTHIALKRTKEIYCKLGRKDFEFYLVYLISDDKNYDISEDNFHCISLINFLKKIKYEKENIEKLSKDSTFRFFVDKTHLDFEDENDICKLRNSDNLTLFLGAGVSIESGIPAWEDFIKKLSAKIFRSCGVCWCNIGNFLSHIRALKLLLGEGEHESFNSIFQKTLYESLREKNLTLDAVSALILRKGIKNIITYNFDDLLESKLRSLGNKNIQSITSDFPKKLKKEINIFHVHGFVGQKDEFKGNIIFSEEEYNKLFSDSTHWGNVVQLKFLKSGACLFIGCSFEDPNIKRLLDIIHNSDKKNYAIMLQMPCKTDLLLKDLHLKSLGINPIWCASVQDIVRKINKI